MILNELKHIVDAKNTYICCGGQAYLADEIFKKDQFQYWKVVKIEPRVYESKNKVNDFNLKIKLHVHIEHYAEHKGAIKS